VVLPNQLIKPGPDRRRAASDATLIQICRGDDILATALSHGWMPSALAVAAMLWRCASTGRRELRGAAGVELLAGERQARTDGRVGGNGLDVGDNRCDPLRLPPVNLKRRRG
jgi:hypothetical protein